MSNKQWGHGYWTGFKAAQETQLKEALSHDELEQWKHNAWVMFKASPEPKIKAKAVEWVMKAHFFRSGGESIKNHPPFEVFAAHWLAANPACYFDEGTPRETLEILRNKFPPPEVCNTARGRSYWRL
jgi:hypothetical protein